MRTFKMTKQFPKKTANSIILWIIFNGIMCILRRKQFNQGVGKMMKLNCNCYMIYVWLWLLQLCMYETFVAATNTINACGITVDGVVDDDGFGDSIDAHENFVIVGAPYEDNDNVTNSGSAYIFDYKFEQFTKLTACDAASDHAQFGRSVAIFDDIAVVGSPGDSYNNVSYLGSVYIFQYNTTTESWNQTAKLTVSDAVYRFGVSVAIASYENYYHVIIGTLLGEKAYVFRYNSSNAEFNQLASLVPGDVQDYNSFGVSVGIYGNFVIVGSFGDDNFRGSAYIFRYNEVNDSWSEVVKLRASDGRSSDIFGRSVAIYNDTAIIGAPSYDDKSGCIYSFKYNESTESWIEVSKYTASDYDPDESRLFGWDVDRVNDLIIVGSVRGAYVFQYNSVNHTWDEVAKFGAFGSDTFHHAGPGVAINGNLSFVGCSGCMNDLLFATIDELQLPPITLKIDYDYKTSMDIMGIDNNNDDYFFTINECGLDKQFSDTLSWIVEAAGCYSVTFYDCDDSVVSDRTDYHGSYEIEVYGVLAGVGGYYFDSETHVICTNNIYNHVSFCINPQFCINNEHLWTNESEIPLSSHNAVVNSTITATTDEVLIICSGDNSCYNSEFKVCCIILFCLQMSIIFVSCVDCTFHSKKSNSLLMEH